MLKQISLGLFAALSVLSPLAAHAQTQAVNETMNQTGIATGYGASVINAGTQNADLDAYGGGYPYGYNNPVQAVNETMNQTGVAAGDYSSVTNAGTQNADLDSGSYGIPYFLH